MFDSEFVVTVADLLVRRLNQKLFRQWAVHDKVLDKQTTSSKKSWFKKLRNQTKET